MKKLAKKLLLLFISIQFVAVRGAWNLTCMEL